MRNLLKCIGLVFRHGGFPAFLLTVLIVTNGALAPLSVWLWQNIIDSVTANIGNGSLAHTVGEGGFMAAVPWIAAFVFVLLLYNMRELSKQVLMIGITHRLRDNLLPAIADKILNLDYWCFEDRNINDLISRVGNSPENQFTRVF